MNINKYSLTLISFLFIFSVYSQAGNTVQVRLVEAYNSNTKTELPSSLQDVSSLLKKNLPYNSFSLLGSSDISLPSSGPVNMTGYQLTLQGRGKILSVRVIQNRKVVLQSKVKLKPKSPVILGGFAGKRGKIMFILNLR